MAFDHTIALENETERTYVYGETEIAVAGATSLSWNDKDPDRHYLKTTNGLFMVLPGYRAIVISAPEWELT